MMGELLADRLLIGTVWLITLLAPTPSPEPVYDTQSDGFAAQIVPALVILGILILAAVWTSQRPRDFKRRRR